MDEYSFFARIYDPFLYLVLHKIRKQVVEIVKHYKPHSIIDICCGTGNQLKYLKKQGFNNITGVDISRSMLQQAKKGKENIQCKNQDASQMDFSNDSFDMGIISFALHEKPYDVTLKIINETSRIVSPNGHIIIVDYLFNNQVKFPLRYAIHFVEKLAGKYHYRYFRNYLQYGGLDHLMKNYLLKEDYLFHQGATGIRVYKNSKQQNYA